MVARGLLFSDVRQRVEAQVVAELGGAGWRASRYAYDLFPGPDSRQVEHLAFAVGVPRTTPEALDRQSRALGITVRTGLGVRFTCRLRADAQVGDFDAALDHEVDLIRCVHAALKNPEFSIRYTGTTLRQVLADGTVWYSETSWEVLHRLPLT